MTNQPDASTGEWIKREAFDGSWDVRVKGREGVWICEASCEEHADRIIADHDAATVLRRVVPMLAELREELRAQVVTPESRYLSVRRAWGSQLEILLSDPAIARYLEEGT